MAVFALGTEKGRVPEDGNPGLHPVWRCQKEINALRNQCFLTGGVRGCVRDAAQALCRSNAEARDTFAMRARALAALIFGAFLIGFAAADPPELLRPAPADLSLGRGAPPRALRSAAAVVDADLLLSNPPMLSLNLFGDTRAVAVRTRAYEVRPGVFIWEGAAVGQKLGSVTIACYNGTVVANLAALDAAYTLSPLGSRGLIVVTHVNRTAYRPEGHPLKVPGTGSKPPNTDAGSNDGSGKAAVSFIDVLVVYTAKALEYAGSHQAVVAHAELAAAIGNRAFVDSGVTNAMLRIAKVAFVNYVESASMSLDLQRLVTAGDGRLDEALALRDGIGVDIMSLWTISDQYCGLGYTTDGFPTASFAQWAANVVDISCAINSYTFIHELGHNLGMLHDRDNAVDGGAGAYPEFGYGYQQRDGLWRTIMAYDCPNSCPRLPYYSTPYKWYKGRVLGIASGLRAANNARVLRNTAPVVAAFRSLLNPGPNIPTQKHNTFSIPTKRLCVTFGDGFIPDGNTVSFPVKIAAPASSIVYDLKLHVDMRHSAMRDLRISLMKNPFHTFAYSSEGCTGLLNIRRTIIFDDEALPNAGRFTGRSCAGATRLRPSMPLSMFVGQPVAGTWTVTVADGGPGGAGRLFGFCLVFKTYGSITASR